MFNFTKKRQIHILILIGILVIYLVSIKNEKPDRNLKNDGEIDVIYEEDQTEDGELEDKDGLIGYNNTDGESPDENNSIAVHIKGAVYSPGIVMAEEGERLVDVIEKAGGLTSDADIDRINLALRVEDEAFIHIPAVGEVAEEDVRVGRTDDGDSGLNLVSINGKSDSNKTDKININKADKEELKKLSGVGESTAEKIIQYREETKFNAIEDIMEVSGIGEKKFEAIRDSIAVR